MKLKPILIGPLVGLIFILSGCGSSNAIPLDDQSLVWTGTRDNLFGTYETGPLSSSKEAEKILKETFSVIVPSFFADSEKVIDQFDFLQSYDLEETTYSVTSAGNELTYERISAYVTPKDKNRQVVRVNLQIVYQVDTETKQVKTTHQELKMNTTPSETSSFYKALPTLTERTAKFLHLSSGESTIDQVIKKYPEQDSGRELEGITIVSSDKNQEPLKKNIQLYYDVYGYMTEWSAEIRYD
ncbi:hypothetical protein CI088_01535 [Enterococcus plantarum]|uniref:Uncharacterized protein n=1 Tax=Enterococcus plantarum TaxID=1077675 RepID=A0A2W3ZJK9_9ENTE|nr:hypothetical protein [Enterococcus plantarum]PZL77510.1 hypothetical protein CI088_01535 [Enterococcus plantarum]